MIFRSLKMAGFKSFAESADIDIDSGLTGVVGPNGCGKSNIVEGLRWVMGESSARQMRGDEMDDVIFAGTEKRPARNLAEITLRLDNTTRRAPAEFNDVDELEVTRKIERVLVLHLHLCYKSCWGDVATWKLVRVYLTCTPYFCQFLTFAVIS